MARRLELGKRTLTFMETRMLHWPDSMFTYLPEEKMLFSSDGFGQHYAGFEKFDDVIGDTIMPHAKKYFANILLLLCAADSQADRKGDPDGPSRLT
jgi:flavorubredoxin